MKTALINLLVVASTFGFACGLADVVGGDQELSFGVPLLCALAVIAFAVQWLMFIPAYMWQTEHYYDLTGSCTYLLLVLIAVAAAGVGATDWRALLLTGLISVWALRLGSFLFRRVKQVGKDARFDQLKRRWSAFLVAWTLQGLWVFLTLLAALIAITSSAPATLDVWMVIGLLIWLCGFSLEVIADAQKSAFKANRNNAGRYINVGLWAWSRHPNYFGEIVLWLGITVIAAPVFSGWQWLGLISPIFVVLLLTRVSGIPILERRAEEKWGDQPDYQKYRDSTPVLIPRRPA